jgi:hypothetical protein
LLFDSSSDHEQEHEHDYEQKSGLLYRSSVSSLRLCDEALGNSLNLVAACG